MPILDNQRYELFAQNLAKGYDQDKAYERAGYKHDFGHASRLAKRQEIVQRWQELASKGADDAGITTKSLIADAERVQQGAMKDGNWAAAVAAIKEKGVLSGKRIERRESGEPGEFAAIEAMSASELVAFLRDVDDKLD